MRKHIAFFLPNLNAGGAEKVNSILASGLARRGFIVDMVLVKAEGPFLHSLDKNINIVNLASASTYTCLPALMAYLQQNKPAAVVSGLDLTNLTVLMARKLSRYSFDVIVQLHNVQSIHKRTRIKKFFEKWLIRLLYPTAKAIIAVSEGVREDFCHYIGIKNSVLTIYNPIITPDLYIKAQDLVQYPWIEHKTVPLILSVGRLSAQKNHALLIRAFMKVRETMDARLLILGEGGERDALTRLIQDLNLEEYVHLAGLVANPYSLMARSDLFALSSLYEGLPTVLVEAMACGCPVVSTDCPFGPDEITHHGDYGYLTPVGDVQALADAMLGVLMGRAKRPPYEWLKQFTEESVIQKYEKLLAG